MGHEHFIMKSCMQLLYYLCHRLMLNLRNYENIEISSFQENNLMPSREAVNGTSNASLFCVILWLCSKSVWEQEFLLPYILFLQKIHS